MFDRIEAGRALAGRLVGRPFPAPPVVLAITASAVPIAFEIAHALHAELDWMEVRPFPVPGQPGVELGVVASGGLRVVHAKLQAKLGLDEEAVAAAAQPQRDAIHVAEQMWRRRHPRPDLGGQTVVIVAEQAGADARLDAAVLVARATGALRVIVAVPGGLTGSLQLLREDADEVISLTETEDEGGLATVLRGPAPTEAEVRAMLERSEEWRAPVPMT